jgi:hypothetical protein
MFSLVLLLLVINGSIAEERDEVFSEVLINELIKELIKELINELINELIFVSKY